MINIASSGPCSFTIRSYGAARRKHDDDSPSPDSSDAERSTSFKSARTPSRIRGSGGGHESERSRRPTPVAFHLPSAHMALRDASAMMTPHLLIRVMLSERHRSTQHAHHQGSGGQLMGMKAKGQDGRLQSPFIYHPLIWRCETQAR